MTNVLLVGTWVDQAFTFIRSLSRQPSVELYVADCWPAAAGMHSRHARRAHLIPHYDDPGYIPALLDVCQKERIDVVIPLHHEDVVAIAPFRDEFTQRGYRVPMPDSWYITVATDKYLMASLATAYGIATPETHLLHESGWQSLPYPLMVKLRYSTGQRGMKLVHDEWELAAHCDGPLLRYRPEEILIQQYIPGTVRDAMWTVGLLYGQDHELLACVPLKKIRSRKFTGGTAVCTVAQPHPGIERMAVEVVQAVGPWVGIADVEIKTNPQGRPFFIELNPRPWGSIYGAYVAGVDFPWLLVQSAMGEPVEPVDCYSFGTAGAVLSRDLALLRDVLGALVRGENRREAWEVLGTYRRPYLERRSGYPAAADFVAGDLKPFWKAARRLW